MLFSCAGRERDGPFSVALREDGWAVIVVADPAEAAARVVADQPALILLDGAEGSRVAALLAALKRLATAVPVIALIPAGAPRCDVRPDGSSCDDRIEAATPAALVAALRPWRPGDLLAGARRLEAAFGRDEIGAMIAGFRAQLAEAVDRLDRAGDAGLAHRIAGLAGTLGFAAVSSRWLAVSEGDAAASGDAQREARMALAAIDRAGAARRQGTDAAAERFPP